ncbi:hypothetical protein Lupro_11300 [Lutibacter profundi]|uniref:Transporter n=1 Tax=Lutibacter profundi TaxID=1622118 RepID=A0A120IEJ0_9FLAO|nr:hypothetical protein [Lutibacter profundi]AMC11816.1 hypothetical protein Lupro_11300 [Lutibacter profundi]
MNLKTIVFLLAFILPFNLIKAQTCCSGGIPLSNNIGMAILETGTTQIGVNYDYNNLNTLNNGSNKLDDDSRLRITHSILVNASYAITDNFSIEGLFTWVNQRRKITQFGNENLDQTSGIGDGLLLIKYNFSDILKNKVAINIGIGTKIPFGSSTQKNNQGIILNADLQPGSNAWDIVYWSSFLSSFNFRPTFNISSRFIYRSTGTNSSYFGDSTYKFGNEFQAFIGFSDQFLFLKTMLYPSVTFKYRNAIQDKIGGFNLENTGGNWLFIIPNISINIGTNIVFYTRAELPIYSNIDGTQLTPTYRLTSGILFTIRPPKQLINLN